MTRNVPRALPERDIQRRSRQRMLGTMDLRENAVDSRVLRSSASDDNQRAVDTNHQKTNSTTNESANEALLFTINKSGVRPRRLQELIDELSA